MNIFLKECKSNLIPILIWLSALVTVHYVASIEFAVFASDPSIGEAMEQFSEIFKIFGTTPQDMTTPEGFLSILSIYITLPLAIYSGLLGSGIISKEEKDRTAEFLFTLPVSRRKVLFGKILVALLYSVLINVVVLGSIALIYARFTPGDVFYDFLRNMAFGTFITQVMFLSIGVALSSILKYYKQSGMITIAILMSSFMLNILIGYVEELDFLKYISPFSYFNANLMLAGTYEVAFILLSIVIVGAGIGSLFYFYPKRDLYI